MCLPLQSDSDSLTAYLSRGAASARPALAVALTEALETALLQGKRFTYLRPDFFSLSGTESVVLNEPYADHFVALTDERTDRLLVHTYSPPTEMLNGAKDPELSALLYSLGCILYELFAGHPPFQGRDAQQLRHQHLTAEPTPLCVVDDMVPECLSKIIAHLLAKTPDQRYRTVQGLRYDLEQWQTGRTCGSFVPGARDISPFMEVPDRLYGRRDELSTLLDNFMEVKAGACRLVAIGGYSGVGKTALVNALGPLIASHNGCLATGKFDQYTQKRPYGALIQAVASLLRRILTEPPESLERWRTGLRDALDDNGSVMVDMIPELELIVGKQPDAVELSPDETGNRFKQVFLKLLNVFFIADRPLVLFLDDMQWSDAASLRLIEQLLRSQKTGPVLMVAAYRSNEVEKGHPLETILSGLKASNCHLFEMTLEELPASVVTELLVDTFRLPEHRVIALADLCMQKTHGNPFFLRQLLTILYEDGTVHLNEQTQQWQYNPLAISGRRISENVVHFLTKKIERLPHEAVEMLCTAACIGDMFSLELLAAVCKRSESVVSSLLWIVVKEGLLTLPNLDAALESGEGCAVYRFTHDKVRQAAYSLIPSTKRADIHTCIGNAMLATYTVNKIDAHLFDIADQLVRGSDVVKDETKRLEYAAFFLRAGQKAGRAVAYGKAESYYTCARKMLCENPWESHYDLTLDLFSSRAENYYCVGQYDEMKQLVRDIETHATSLLNKVRGIEVRIQSQYARKHSVRAAREGLDALAQLGCKFPKRPTKFTVIFEYLKMQLRTRKLDEKRAAKLPTMTDPLRLAAMRILLHTLLAVHRFHPELMHLTVLKIVDYTIRYGVAPPSIFGFSTFGMIMVGLRGDISSARRMEKVSALLAESASGIKYKGRATYLNATMVHHWRASLRDTFSPMTRAHHLSCKYGDIEFASLAEGQRLSYEYMAGVSLSRLSTAMENCEASIRKWNQVIHLTMLQITKQSLSMLTNIGDEALTMPPPEEVKRRVLDELGEDRTIIFLSLFYPMVNFSFLGYIERGIEYAAAASPYLDALAALAFSPVFHFHEVLLKLRYLCKHKKRVKREIRTAYMRSVQLSLKKLKRWSKNAPMNFDHKIALIQAVLAQQKGDVRTAMTRYAQAM